MRSRSLQGRLSTFELIVESHYRYYQFYANMLIALIFAYGAWRHTCCTDSRLWDMAFVVVVSVLFLGSRDTLKKYYRRSEQLAS